jgi:nucleoside-diphosphate-sugar epimerase
MAKDTFLVTGSSGCLGSWVLRALITEGVRVVAADASEDYPRPRLLMSPGGGSGQCGGDGEHV